MSQSVNYMDYTLFSAKANWPLARTEWFMFIGGSAVAIASVITLVALVCLLFGATGAAALLTKLALIPGFLSLGMGLFWKSVMDKEV